MAERGKRWAWHVPMGVGVGSRSPEDARCAGVVRQGREEEDRGDDVGVSRSVVHRCVVHLTDSRPVLGNERKKPTDTARQSKEEKGLFDVGPFSLGGDT